MSDPHPFAYDLVGCPHDCGWVGDEMTGIEFHGTGFGTAGPGTVQVVKNGREIEELPPRNDLRDHSPDGFQCGYGGSGPAQLSLALLAYVFDDDTAETYYQRFKRDVIAKIDRDEWALTEALVREWHANQERMR